MRILLSLLSMLLSAVATAQPLTFHQLTVRDGLPNNGVIALGEDARGRIWVATFEGLGYLDNGSYVPLPAEQLPDIRVDRIHRDRHGTMWVRCFERRQEVSRYDPVGHRFKNFRVSELNDSLRQLAVQPLNRTFADPRSPRVWQLEKHQLWQTDTLQPDRRFVYTGETAARSGLTDEALYTLMLDSHGILWAGSATGGLFFAHTRQLTYRRLVCQPNPVARAVCADRQGHLWIGLGFDGLKVVNPRDNHYYKVHYPMTDSIEGWRVRVIREDSRGTVWVGTHDGLYAKAAKSETFHRVDNAAAGKRLEIYSLCEDEEQRLWIGATTGLYVLSLNDRERRVSLVDSTVVMGYHIATHEGRLWIGAESGLFSREGNTTRRWTDMVVKEMAIDATGTVWVGTVSGLCRLTPHGVERVSTAADGHAVKGLISWRDFLWCSYDQGICCINIYTGKHTQLRTEYNEYNSFATCCDEQTGRLYFCGIQGIDCFAADSLDTQLRTSTGQLLLAENRILMTDGALLQQDSGRNVPWGYVVLTLMAMGGCAAGARYYYKYKRGVAAMPRDDVQAAATAVPEAPQAPPQTQIQAPPQVQPQASSQAQPQAPLLPVSTMPEPVRRRFVAQATALVQAHLKDTEWTAEQMAQEMAMSRSKLFTLMKDATGKGVMEFVRDIRLEHSVHLLMDGVPVAEIAYQCGFSEASSFRRSFAKKYGVNPSQYRRNPYLSPNPYIPPIQEED